MAWELIQRKSKVEIDKRLKISENGLQQHRLVKERVIALQIC